MNKELSRIIAVVVAILLLRIGIVNLYEYFGAIGGMDMFDAMGVIAFDPINLPTTLSLTLLLGYLADKIKWLRACTFFRVISWVVVVIFCALISTFIATSQGHIASHTIEWFSMLLASVVFCTVLILALYLWLWFRSSRRYISKVIAKSERTNYQYVQLKQQLNPHFLFNSLSILDYLVQEQQTERASDYIKKLANIYRYLLKQEEYDTIALSKEVDFLNLYIDIMRERFLDGFEIDIDLSAKVLSRQVVPCALQVLVENAFKHNSATTEHKLKIRIWSEKGKVIVQNNINLKQTPSTSNGFGLKNLRGQYSVLSGESIEVIEDGEQFIVKIPLL